VSVSVSVIVWAARKAGWH